MNRNKILRSILSDDPSVKSDFTIVFLYCKDMEAAFWRRGDIARTYIRCIRGTIQEAVFIRGTLYVSYAMGAIYTIELGPNPTATLVGPNNPPITGVYYLVECMGELMLIICRNPKKFFELDKVDLKEKEYFPCTYLGDYAIFLGLVNFRGAKEMVSISRTCFINYQHLNMGVMILMSLT